MAGALFVALLAAYPLQLAGGHGLEPSVVGRQLAGGVPCGKDVTGEPQVANQAVSDRRARRSLRARCCSRLIVTMVVVEIISPAAPADPAGGWVFN